jgi:hypothetical protein
VNSTDLEFSNHLTEISRTIAHRVPQRQHFASVIVPPSVIADTTAPQSVQARE